MELIVGKYSGFCKGVSYTYLNALKELKKGKVFCLGEIIHNEHVIKDLENKGMTTVSSLEEVDDNSKVIFRAHGESEDRYLYAKKHGIDVIDLTCEKVKIIHNKVKEKKNDSFIVIIGKKTHPEIIGTVGFAGSNSYVVEDENDFDLLEEKLIESFYKKIFVISQTTFSSTKFDYLVNVLKERFKEYDITIDKSICNATELRQKECEEISKKVNLMVVIGSKNSSNTKELYNISEKNCNKVYFVENREDVDKINISFDMVVGVVAGASAPKALIDEIVNYIKEKSNEN